jgi:hypothetical protein
MNFRLNLYVVILLIIKRYFMEREEVIWNFIIIIILGVVIFGVGIMGADFMGVFVIRKEVRLICFRVWEMVVSFFYPSFRSVELI